ncbi:MAG: 5'-3' exonuclease [Verrucomicrobiae bacterium]|nr:5'-3' exonuclease [Verrucomicrobiae bacterium]
MANANNPGTVSSKERGVLLLVDGHAYGYRAFHAIRGLTSPTGRPTNAIFGFVRMLTKLRDSIKPTHVAVIWDGGLSAERLAALPDYKAQRPPMPAELKEQLDEIEEYLDAAGIPSLKQPGVEADDYIACIARCAAAAGLRVIIASSDKDFLQLVSPDIVVVNPNDRQQTPWTVERVKTQTGVFPNQIVDWLSLTGDTSDNIPGVPGVGPKTAADLLARFGSVAELFERLNEVSPEKLRSALEAAREVVERNRGLVKLKDDLECEFKLSRFEPRPPDTRRLRELFTRWGFKSLLAQLEPESCVEETQAALL